MLSSEQENGFLNALAANGISPHSNISLITGKIVRYRVAGDKGNSENGWYVLYADNGIAAGAFGSWKTGISASWCSKSEREFSAKERELWQKSIIEAQRLREAERVLVNEEARKKAEYLWNIAKPAAAVSGDGASRGVHPYLVSKQVRPFGLRVLNSRLLVPVRNAAGGLSSVQFINGDGAKTFLTGGAVAGCYFAIGKPVDVLLICEGYATGASLREATGHAVAVAFNAGNLLEVAKAMRVKFQTIKIVLCADNDQATEGNPGLRKAQECAVQVEGMVSVPTFDEHDTIDGKKPTDFNDLHCLHGLAAVRTAVERALLTEPLGGSGVVEAVAECTAAGEKEGTVENDGLPKTVAEFTAAVENSADFDYLTEFLLIALAKSALKRPAVEYVIAQIAKKADTTKAALLDEYKRYSARNGANFSAPVASDDVIAAINENHAVLPMGGRIVIMNRDYDPVQEKRLLSFSSKSDFELRYCNKQVHGVPLGEYWLTHPDRAEYKGLVFLPGGHSGDYLNLWMGWGLEPVKGDCSFFCTFIHEVICNSDDEIYEYVINWCAHLVQRPQELPETALVLRGREGIGKNRFVETLMKIVGHEHCLLLSSLNQITGRFSGHLANALLVFCNESVWGGDKSAQGVLKSMVTDRDQPIEYKGRDLSMVRSFRRAIFATNEDWAVPRGADDRRYVVADVSDKRKGDFAYFQKLSAALDGGGTAAFYQYLLEIDLAGWHPRKIPARILSNGFDMKINSAGSVVRWWVDILKNGYLYIDGNAYSDESSEIWPERIAFPKLNGEYLAYCNRYKINHPEHSVLVAKTLRALGLKSHCPRDGQGGRLNEYLLPTLGDARAIFSAQWNVPDSFW